MQEVMGMRRDASNTAQSDRPSEPASTLALVACLLVVACATALGGMVGGALRLATARFEENPWSVLLQGLGLILAGWILGALLWAAAWLVRRQGEILHCQKRALEVMLQSGGAVAPGAGVELAEKPDLGEVGVSKQLLAQMAELNANLLLTPEQRQAKLQEQAIRVANELVDQIERTIEDGRLTQAYEDIESLARQFPDESRVGLLRDRLARQWALQVKADVESGDLDAAEKKLERMASRFPGHARLGELDEQLARGYAAGVERALASDDLGLANQRLDRLRQRWPERAEIQALRERIEQNGAAVRAEEIAEQRRHIQELMAMAAYDKAEAAAVEVAHRHPGSADALALLDLVRRDALAFRMDRGQRLYMDVQKHAEMRRWRQAVEAAHRLIQDYPQTPEAEHLRTQMATLEENARIEEVRELRDLIRENILAKQYNEALRLAQDVVRRFPGTQAASELGRQIIRLRELAFVNP
ncbi:MAG: hypothetical protein BWX88_00210 [Planctomycetes bacterium ADurb.Bin126]|nr:MAG: hypothetical protein BWX88_00210 [Planctomycetes bacterium ADurb.Bin126]